MQEFIIQDEMITADDFSTLLKCVRGFQVEMCQSHKSSFLQFHRSFIIRVLKYFSYRFLKDHVIVNDFQSIQFEALM
jgi:hypothetical protein